MGAEDMGTHGQQCPPTPPELHQEGPTDKGLPAHDSRAAPKPTGSDDLAITPQDVSSHLPAWLSLTLKL